VRVVGREEIMKYAKDHADVRRLLYAWLADIENGTWLNPQEVLDHFPRASFIRDGLAVFRIKGNDYRLEALFGFNSGVVRVLRIGTHAEYDTWTL
jgi:mRNA interferase HigB